MVNINSFTVICPDPYTAQVQLASMYHKPSWPVDCTVELIFHEPYTAQCTRTAIYHYSYTAQVLLASIYHKQFTAQLQPSYIMARRLHKYSHLSWTTHCTVHMYGHLSWPVHYTGTGSISHDQHTEQVLSESIMTRTLHSVQPSITTLHRAQVQPSIIIRTLQRHRGR